MIIVFFGTGLEAGQTMPNWETVARAFGVLYEDIQSIDELGPSVDRFEENRKATLINVRLTPNEKLLPKCAAMPQEDGKIVSMPLEDMTPLLPLEKLNEIMENKLNQLSVSVRTK